MRSYQVFAALSPERARDVMRGLAEKQPGVWVQALAAASAAMNARPVYLKRQPPEKQADAVRRALSRVNADAVAAEVLAVYFLECRRPLLVEWLDIVGLEHEDGILAADAPAEPPEAQVRAAAERFLAADADDADRPLLLAAFSAQDAIEWPALEALVPR